MPEPQATHSPLKEVIDLLLHTNDKIKVLLKGTVHEQMTLLSLTSSMNRMINQVAHISGLSLSTSPQVEFPPVTNFMGEKIELPKEIKTEDLEPAEREKQIFVGKVEKLYAAFDTIAPEGILNSYTLPEDQLVIRGVAKKAGVPSYEDATINLFFLDKISKAIQLKKVSEIEQAKMEEQLKKQQQIVNLKQRISEVEAKRAALDQDKVEAEADIPKALNPTAKKMAEKKLAQIQAEIVDAINMHTSLIEQLNKLQS